MTEEVIERVDSLVRKNNIKYKQQMNELAYQQALKQHQQHHKAQQLKSYAETVKIGNKRAIEKAKEIKQAEKAKKRRKKRKASVPEARPSTAQPARHKMTENQLKMANQTIQARAERLIQQKQLQRLDQQLQTEKKRTKLHELNQKCKKLISKSHQRVAPVHGIPEERMKMLKELEERVMGEVNELDGVISNLVDHANRKPTTRRKQVEIPRETPLEGLEQQDQEAAMQEQWEKWEEYLQSGPQPSPEKSRKPHAEQGQSEWDPLSSVLFSASGEQLLGMPYIPI